MTAGTALEAVAQSLLWLAVGWVTSESFFDRMERPRSFGAPERMLFAIVGGVAFSIILMVANIVTGGAVFGLPGVVPAVALVAIIAGRRRFSIPRNIPWIPLVLLGALLLFLFVAPTLAGGSGVRTGDSPWHLGWSEQLLHGHPVPTGPAPNFGRNAYPWGWHAVVATLVRLVPGSEAVIAYEALQLILLAGIPLAAACLARRLEPAAGWAAAVAVSLVGGFGWIVARTPAFVTTPRGARFGADLVVASPNSVYELLPPALPRELGLVMLGAACAFIVVAVRSERKLYASIAGLCVGLLGLVSAPLFVSGLIWLLAAFLFGGGARSKLLWALAPALVVLCLWAAPVLTDYLRFGGFVNITASLGREWGIVTGIGSWGLLAPIAVIGVFLVVREPQARPLIACLAGTVLVLSLAIARGMFDWTLGGNATLLHQGRVWPAAHLLGAAFAGVAVTRWFRWMKERSEAVAGAILAVALGVAIVSPLFASLRLTEIIAAQEQGFVYGSEDLQPDSFVRRSADVLGPDDIVRVEGSDHLAFTLFQFSGVKLADYDDPRFDHNDLRIRYRDLAREWDAQLAAGGFDANFLVLPDPEPDPSLGDVWVTGTFEGQPWSLVSTTPAEG